jgi:hypothetical protein
LAGLSTPSFKLTPPKPKRRPLCRKHRHSTTDFSGGEKRTFHSGLDSASLPKRIDGRTHKARLLNGRSKPEGAKKKRPLVGRRLSGEKPNPTG